MKTPITPEALIEMGKPQRLPLPGQTIVVWFSCGAASAVAAKKTIELYGKTNIIRVVNNPIKEEDDDNRRFLKDCEIWLGMPIESAVNSKYPDCSIKDVFEDQNFMSNVGGLAYCTLELKQRARFEWESKNRPDWTVLGFTKEEKNRFDRFKLKRLTSLFILKDTTKFECFQIIQNAGIELPMAYKLGMPNANCKGCIKATSPTYWNLVRQIYPDDFNERAEQSRQIGAKLVRVKSKRIFLDELDPKAHGRPLKNLNFECGIFCNTK
jgi:hypothetical protein